MLELDARGPAGRLSGIAVRLYDAQAKQWNLNWVSGRDMLLTTPSVGSFHDGRGEFVDVEPWDGREIFVRGLFTGGKRFEQAFSADGGKTWETNWVMTFEKEEHRATW